MPEPVDSELFSLWPGLERLSLHVDGELPPNLLGDMPSLTHLHLVLSDPDAAGTPLPCPQSPAPVSRRRLI